MFDLRTDVWLQEVSTLMGQGECKTNSYCVCACAWVSLCRDPLRGQMFKAKSLHEDFRENFYHEWLQGGGLTDPLTSVVCLKLHIRTYEKYACCIFLQTKMLYFGGFNDLLRGTLLPFSNAVVCTSSASLYLHILQFILHCTVWKSNNIGYIEFRKSTKIQAHFLI